MQMVSRYTLCKITTRSVVSTAAAAKGSRKQVLGIRRFRRSSNTEVDRYTRVVGFCSRHEYANLRACSPIRPHTLADYFFFTFGLSIFGVGASRFNSSRSPVLCFFNFFSCLLCVLCIVKSTHLRFGHPIFRYPHSSIFNVLNSISSYVFLFRSPCHLSHASLLLSHMFSAPALAVTFFALFFSLLFIYPLSIQHSHPL